jgi:hypothetical protein
VYRDLELVRAARLQRAGVRQAEFQSPPAERTVSGGEDGIGLN